jgi:glutathione S-transferase
VSTDLPILYSFRRCPYAMRARMALRVAGIEVELREVSLRDKPTELLAASPKGTVPVLVLPEGEVIDESLDIMRWALAQSDPGHWLAPGEQMVPLIAVNDGPFKFHLDRAKYANRYPGDDPAYHRGEAVKFLAPLEDRLAQLAFLFDDAPSLADIAIFPFVRQFARADETVLTGSPLLKAWLTSLESSVVFRAVMEKEKQPGKDGLPPSRASAK